MPKIMTVGNTGFGWTEGQTGFGDRLWTQSGSRAGSEGLLRSVGGIKRIEGVQSSKLRDPGEAGSTSNIRGDRWSLWEGLG